jgi:hypothetical protein
MRRVEMNGPSNLTFSPAGRHPQLCNRETLRLPCSCVELIHLAERLATPFTAHDVVELPRVDVVLSYPGADAALIHAALAPAGPPPNRRKRSTRPSGAGSSPATPAG